MEGRAVAGVLAAVPRRARRCSSSRRSSPACSRRSASTPPTASTGSTRCCRVAVSFVAEQLRVTAAETVLRRRRAGERAGRRRARRGPPALGRARHRAPRDGRDDRGRASSSPSSRCARGAPREDRARPLTEPGAGPRRSCNQSRTAAAGRRRARRRFSAVSIATVVAHGGSLVGAGRPALRITRRTANLTRSRRRRDGRCTYSRPSRRRAATGRRRAPDPPSAHDLQLGVLPEVVVVGDRADEAVLAGLEVDRGLRRVSPGKSVLVGSP